MQWRGSCPRRIRHCCGGDFAKAKTAHDTAAEDYTGLGKAANDPDRPRLSEAEYAQIAEAYERLLEWVRGVDRLKQAVEQRIASIKETMEQSRGAVAEATAALETATAEVVRIKESGFKAVSADQALEKARASLAEATGCLEKRRYALAMTSAKDTKTLAGEAGEAAARLPGMRQEIEAGVAGLTERVERVKSLIVEGRTLFERLS